jgi:hypothetical protein
MVMQGSNGLDGLYVFTDRSVGTLGQVLATQAETPPANGSLDPALDGVKHTPNKLLISGDAQIRSWLEMVNDLGRQVVTPDEPES